MLEPSPRTSMISDETRMRDAASADREASGRIPPLFSPGATRRFRLALLGAALLPAVVVGALMLRVRTAAATGQYARVAQPMRFDHRIHAGALAIDCRYCHAESERAATAGMPPTEACVGCHQPAYIASATFAAVRTSLTSGTPVPWRRVHRLPDFVYFDHSVHVANGVACETCHGRVDRMGVVTQQAPLTMQWCLACHRNPRGQLRPREAVTAMGWQGESAPLSGPKLRRVSRLADCTTCHR